MIDIAVLQKVAKQAGITTQWIDNDGVERAPSPQTLQSILAALGLPCHSAIEAKDILTHLQRLKTPSSLPSLVTGCAGHSVSLPLAYNGQQRFHIEYEHGVCHDGVVCEGADGAAQLPAIDTPGYHRLECNGQSVTLAIAPSRCWTFADAASGKRLWGTAAQVYGLHSNRNRHEALPDFGLGTFGHAAILARNAADKGADAVMISPAHALFHADAGHFSPYSPSSRFHYNPLLADPADVFSNNRLQGVYAAMQGRLDVHGAAAPLIDWPSSSATKYTFLRALYESFKTYECNHDGNGLAADFLKFKTSGGYLLHDHALFETIHAAQYGADFTRWHWRTWSGDLSKPSSAETKTFAEAHGHEIDYHKFLQWLARRSLEAAQEAAMSAGMRIGLVNDLAVGLNTGGSHAWSLQDELLQGLSIGAPPDALAPRGQNWGLTTFSPFALRDTGYQSFLATLRASLDPVGGLRIDHVMGLMRLWLIPDGGEAGDGAYVSNPVDDLLRLICLESQRAQKITIGEDLGTVPPGFRETLGAAGLAGMRVLLFERDDYGYRPPGHYPEDAITMTTTHDSPTLMGWQRGLDIDLRDPLGQLPPGQTAHTARHQRANDKDAMRRVFAQSGLASGAHEHVSGEREERRFAATAIAFAAQTRSHFTAVPLEDIAGQVEQPNLPGTTDEHPNWRRRYASPVETILDGETADKHLAVLQLARGNPLSSNTETVSDEPIENATPLLRSNIS